MRLALAASLLAATAAADPGTVSGRAIDDHATPLPAVRLWAGVQAVSAKPVSGLTAADGTYRLTGLVPTFIYKVFAWHEVKYRGKTFCLRLAPDDDGKTFAGKDGAVRNFRWRLAGRMDDAAAHEGEPGASWGGDVRIFTAFDDEGEGRRIKLELTLTPEGGLIDKSAGKVLQRLVDLEKSPFLVDVPVGVYKVRGTSTSKNGKTATIRFGKDGDAEGRIEFVPLDQPSCGSATASNGVSRAFLTVRP